MESLPRLLVGLPGDSRGCLRLLPTRRPDVTGKLGTFAGGRRLLSLDRPVGRGSPLVATTWVRIPAGALQSCRSLPVFLVALTGGKPMTPGKRRSVDRRPRRSPTVSLAWPGNVTGCTQAPENNQRKPDERGRHPDHCPVRAGRGSTERAATRPLLQAPRDVRRVASRSGRTRIASRVFITPRNNSSSTYLAGTPDKHA